MARNPDARVVAVTGGAGFVGLNIVTALAEAGMPWWRSISRHSMPWPRVHGGVTTGRWSLFIATCAMNTRSQPCSTSTTSLMSCMPQPSPHRAHESTLVMLDVNLRTTQVLLDFAAEQPLRRLIFVSSAGVFRSAESVTPLDEAFPVTYGAPLRDLQGGRGTPRRVRAPGATGRRNISASRVRLRAVRAADEQPHGDVERLRRGRTGEARGADRGDSAGCGARLDPCG